MKFTDEEVELAKQCAEEMKRRKYLDEEIERLQEELVYLESKLSELRNERSRKSMRMSPEILLVNSLIKRLGENDE